MKNTLQFCPIHTSNFVNYKSILFSVLFIFFSFTCPKVTAAQNLARSGSVRVSASIDDNRITLFGFTSPQSRVELSSPKAFAVTYSDNSGYYAFDRLILPKHPGELCLTTIDDNSRRTIPVCIPQPPPTNYHTDIGPVILPPTITIDQETIKPNSTVIASGQGIPNSPIGIFLYQINDKTYSFPKTAHAFGLPVFNTVSDGNGNYSFNLPTAYSSDYRLYSTVKFDTHDSPKSNTLTYHLPSLFSIFWQQNTWLVVALPFFILTVGLFLYVVYIYYTPPKKRYLPAVFYYPLVPVTNP